MRAYCSRLMQSDEGSGTMACVMLIALAAALIATVASVGGALLCRSRARSAADPRHCRRRRRTGLVAHPIRVP